MHDCFIVCEVPIDPPQTHALLAMRSTARENKVTVYRALGGGLAERG
jgi:hypothetical protein